MQRLQINGSRFGRTNLVMAKHPSRSFKKPRPPRRNLVRVHIKLLRSSESVFSLFIAAKFPLACDYTRPALRSPSTTSSKSSGFL